MGPSGQNSYFSSRCRRRRGGETGFLFATTPLIKRSDASSVRRNVTARVPQCGARLCNAFRRCRILCPQRASPRAAHVSRRWSLATIHIFSRCDSVWTAVGLGELRKRNHLGEDRSSGGSSERESVQVLRSVPLAPVTSVVFDAFSSHSLAACVVRESRERERGRASEERKSLPRRKAREREFAAVGGGFLRRDAPVHSQPLPPTTTAPKGSSEKRCVETVSCLPRRGSPRYAQICHTRASVSCLT